MYEATFRATGVVEVTVKAFSLKALSLDYREWIVKNNLGASQCKPVVIFHCEQIPMYSLSYNGKVWNLDETAEVQV